MMEQGLAMAAAHLFTMKLLLHEPILIKPSEPIENLVYFLSNLDQINANIIKTVYVFEAPAPGSAEASKEPSLVLRESLTKVLNHYYPLAGRLGISAEGKLNVRCYGQGALFVDAEATGSVSDLGDLTIPEPARLGKLVYEVPDAKTILDVPPLVVQVTKFECGGFVLGLGVNHCMLDGVAAMEFVNSWAETARGLPLSNPPILDRSILAARVPPQINHPHTEFQEIDEKVISPDADNVVIQRSFCFSPDILERLKKKAMADGGTLLPRQCTSFEALSGLVWKARTESMDMKPEQKTKLLFPVDGRAKFKPPLPLGYMGNSIVLTFALTEAGQLRDKPLSNAVRHVQDAIALVTDDYMRSAIDFFEVTRSPMPFATSLTIAQWSRLSFHTSDFGWGEPVHTGPVYYPKEIILFLSHGEDRTSINVLLKLSPKAMQKFEEILKRELGLSPREFDPNHSMSG